MANGNYALYHNTNGYYNTASGAYALYLNTTGNSNVASGTSALFFNTGDNNMASGAYALYNNSTGAYNTGIGYQADVNSGGWNYSTALGYSASITASRQIRIGCLATTQTINSYPLSIGGIVDWSVVSDGRVKKDIKQNVPGLAFINKLIPVTYNLDVDAAAQIIQRPAIKDKDGKVIKPSIDNTAAKANAAVVYTGFIAQDVEKAAKSLNYDFSGVDAAKNDKDLYGLRYAAFVVPLVKAVQELSSKNDDLQKQIDDLKAMIVSNQSSAGKQQSVILSSASLEQNIPNPFANTTIINYTLPQKFTIAQIVITDNTGKTLKSVNVSGSGKGSLNVDAAILASGAYNYSLVVDGKLIGSKQMILAK